MALGRAARGLPRYYMDVGWWQGPRWAGATLGEVGLFSAMVGYCTKHATDGRLPGDVNALAAVLGLRANEVRKALRAIEQRGRVERVADDLMIVGYVDHNPTAAETETYYAGRSTAGSFGAHVRWHVNEGKVDPTCPHCTSDGTCHDTSDANAMADRSHGLGLDGSTTPQPPAERGATGHDGQHPNCRACGTNPRTQAMVDELAAQRAALTDAEQRTRQARERGEFQPPPADVIAAARRKIPGRPA